MPFPESSIVIQGFIDDAARNIAQLEVMKNQCKNLIVRRVIDRSIGAYLEVREALGRIQHEYNAGTNCYHGTDEDSGQDRLSAPCDSEQESRYRYIDDSIPPFRTQRLSFPAFEDAGNRSLQ